MSLKSLVASAAAVSGIALVAASLGATAQASTTTQVATTARAGVVNAAPGWPSLPTSDFTSRITNPWFPLKVGRSWVSRGVKDGKPTVDTYTVTGQTKVIDGVTASVIHDVLSVHGKPVEATWDWYAQDNKGNVWYFGEDTKEYNALGKVTSTAGTWKAGVNGARPGIYIPADPTIGKGGYQEYLTGTALDHFTVTSKNASIKVPFGSFGHILKTTETTALEPGVVDHKYYVKGLGQVAEISAKGPKETSLLVSVKK